MESITTTKHLINNIMKNLHLLPTDNPSRLFLNKNNDTFFLNEQFDESSPKIIAQNIYITSDSEIKKGDWVLNISNNRIFKQDNYKPDAYTLIFWKKIILTTDTDLIKDGVQAIDDDFLEWFVKNPSCEEVETKLIKDSEDHPELVGNPKEEWFYYEIIIPKEKSKQETLEEALNNYIAKKHTQEDCIG
jgi:hypothetical protein